MTGRASWGKTPRQSVEEECARRGKDEVVAGCIALLRGDDGDGALIFALGGPPARWAVEGGEPGPPYWLRVWALRGLLWAWDDDALPAVETALNDEAWRVREMALKVVARHRLEDLIDPVVAMREDESARVRAAVSRAETCLARGSR
ncbi:HEAT repeat domain-containing protein [Nocardioides sp. KIGAM211]|uniref:HEAT repeat domain-containing protein n=1 Tax=Nocardioides luti TaxID=2761101 RepID=A0A7X0RM59_9ACTN|nr:HEAT repeat domain-containing protein [Nocardioides luti]